MGPISPDRKKHPRGTRRPKELGRLRFTVGLILLLLGVVRGAAAQTSGELTMKPSPEESAYVGRTLDGVSVRTLGDLWGETPTVRSVKAGDTVSGALVRRALRELDRTGNYADLRAELVTLEGRLILSIWVRPRRLIAQIRMKGGILGESEEFRALGLSVGDAITDLELASAHKRLVTLYQDLGYPSAGVVLTPEPVDDPRRALLRVTIRPGEPQTISRVEFQVAPSPHHPALAGPIVRYALGPEDRLDSEAVALANKSLLDSLVASGFYEAQVTHQVLPGGVLLVKVASGPLFSIRIEGNEVFGAAELESELNLKEEPEPRPDLLQRLLERFYVQRGFLDAYIKAERRSDSAGLRSELYIWVREGEQFRITGRVYPCLSGNRSARDLDEEVDGVLAEEFPAVGVFQPPSADVVDGAVGTRSASPRPKSYQRQPWTSYSQKSHAAVLEHLQDLYRSEGYLDAEVGGATVVRRRCSADSPPDRCLVADRRVLPKTSCDARPTTESRVTETCVPSRELGIRCEAEGVLVLPVIAGRQAILYDVELEGNEAFSEQELLDLADLGIGKPLRRAELDGALRRIQERYEEEAYAFAQVDSDIELSADHSRARLVLSVTERSQVHVRRIDIRGVPRTREGLIRSRLALKVGKQYSRSLVRRSQEQLESLSVFTSVTIALEDPGVPERNKVVVVTVAERLPQYLDIKGGFGSVDGFRTGFEYGHRNLGGEAIQLTLRSQLALRPPFLIAEKDVRLKYQELSDLERLERRNTITLAFPEIGLGPLFRFEIELLDLLDNARDFSHTREATALRLLIRPRRQYLVTTGGTIEINDATILGGASLLDYAQDNPSQNIRVPEGRSVAYTQNLSGSWDRRDQPLSATRGTYLSAGVEHVHAVPLGDKNVGSCNEASDVVFAPVCSELLRYTGRAAGYVPITKSGTTLALSFRAGAIQHLQEISRTYPDRLFFMGGVDTLRGYPQFSLVPQDLADQLLDPGDDLSIDDVVLRGGDLFVNPRAELRIPLGGSIQTALFVDAGNLWADQSKFNPLILRYTAGTGVRIETPVGPLVFDYGFNLERLMDAFGRVNDRARDWEDIGAFHFSIGLF